MELQFHTIRPSEHKGRHIFTLTDGRVTFPDEGNVCAFIASEDAPVFAYTQWTLWSGMYKIAYKESQEELFKYFENFYK